MTVKSSDTSLRITSQAWSELAAESLQWSKLRAECSKKGMKRFTALEAGFTYTLKPPRGIAETFPLRLLDTQYAQTQLRQSIIDATRHGLR